MNAKIKSLFFLFAITTLLIFASCENDLYEDTIRNEKRELKTEYVTGDEARHLIGRLKKTLKTKYSISDSNVGRIEMSSIGIILFDEIVKITDTTGYSTYTFKVEHPSSSLAKFFNLTLEEKASGNLVKLMEYTMSDEFAQEFATTMNYKNFRGTAQSFTIINETPCPDSDIIFAIGNVPIPNNGGNGNGNGGVPPSGTPTPPPSGGTTGPTLPGIPGGTYGGTGGTGGNNSGGSGGLSPGALSFAAYVEMIIECLGSGGTWSIPDGSCFANPRNFRIAMPSHSIDPSEPCNPTHQVIIITPSSECERDFMMHGADITWLGNHAGSDDYFQIMNIVNSNCSSDGESMANELIRELKRGSKIDFENKIIIDSTFANNQKAMCVYNKLKNNNAFNEALTPFNMQNPHAFVKLTAGTIDNNFKAVTDPPDSNSIIVITVNSDPVHPNGINQRPNMLLAQTIIHEMLHAELFRRIKVAIGNGSYSAITYDQLIYALQHSQYNDLVNYIRTANDWSHEYMADLWRDTIARVTQEFATGVVVTGTPDQMYLNQAWSGLNSSEIIVWMALDPAERNAINQEINSYITAHSNETCQ